MTELDPPIVLPTDFALWDLLDTLPNSERLSTQHDLIVHRLGFEVEAAFRSSIGLEAFRKWSDYLTRQTTRPALNHLPSMFLNWAIVHAPGVALTGSSSLARAALKHEPRTSAIDFEGSLDQLRQRLLSTHHVLWTSIPGRWFNVVAMRTACEDPNSPFWGTAEGTRWDDFFGPHGTLGSIIDTLVVKDGPLVTSYAITGIREYLHRL